MISSNGKIAIALHDGKYCAEKGFDEEEVIVSEKDIEDCKLFEIPKVVYKDNSGASVPELSNGMIPIKWDGSKWIKANIEEEWYDYEKKEWANVVLVTEGTRNTYLRAQPGIEIKGVDILAYLVWIPRYKYKLFNVNYEVKLAQEIEIEFEDKNTEKSTGSTNGTWLTHPAFTFGDDEINGIWVGKFETTGDATTPTVKPGIPSLRSQILSVQFSTARLFNNNTTYGLTITHDAHMMKNTEWGAVAYLSHSKYGKKDVILKNPSNEYITGCAGDGPAVNASSGCSYHYYTTNGVQASTTGNVYGIYDMSGGAWENVMGAMYNSNGTTISIGTSGFDQTTIDSAEMAKYIDKYTYGATNNNYNRRKLGDATGETRSWWYTTSYFVALNNPWFSRGSEYSQKDDVGVFYYVNTSGNSLIRTFRLAISPLQS